MYWASIEQARPTPSTVVTVADANKKLPGEIPYAIGYIKECKIEIDGNVARNWYFEPIYGPANINVTHWRPIPPFDRVLDLS